jgi:methionyl-tRNA synthetase
MESLLTNTPLLLAIIAWTLPWKGVALWKAARNNHSAWFIALLVINTLAILEIIYIFYFSKKSTKKEPATNG